MSWLAPLLSLLNGLFALFTSAKAESNGRNALSVEILTDELNKAKDIDRNALVERLRRNGF
jgi:hypothetical protein